MPVLLDTHAWVSVLTLESRLSAAAGRAIEAATGVRVSPISVLEISKRARTGKWPEMEHHTARLSALLRERGGFEAPLTGKTCLRAGRFAWWHRDPFDRILAATAELADASIVSTDSAFDTLPSVRRIW